MTVFTSVACFSLIFGVAFGGPVAVEVEQTEATTRDETGSLDGLAAQLKDSLVIPLFLNPFQINKLTCGSIITLYDTSSDDSEEATVAVDVCLTALLLAKLFVVVPIILSNMDLASLEGGIFGIFDTLGESLSSLSNLSRLGPAGSGPEGAPFEAVLENAANKYSGDGAGLKEPLAQFDADQGYVGFGLSGWQSGLQNFPDLSQDTQFRSFSSVGKLEKLLSSSLHAFEQAIHVQKKH